MATIATQPDVHTEDHPFCGNPDCTECHNEEGYEAHLVPYLDEGTMSAEEALRIYFGQTA